MNWKIGQEIVCIKSHSMGAVKEGVVYTIKAIREHCCEGIDLDVGVVDSRIGLFVRCRKCGDRRIHTGIWWISDRLFAPLQDMTEQIKEAMEIKQPQKV